VNRIVEDEELKALRAMADGSKPFEEIAQWEEVAALDWEELKKLAARTRLAVGYYEAARRRRRRPEFSLTILSGHDSR
jgi:hypothetical protein